MSNRWLQSPPEHRSRLDGTDPRLHLCAGTLGMSLPAPVSPVHGEDNRVLPEKSSRGWAVRELTPKGRAEKSSDISKASGRLLNISYQ